MASKQNPTSLAAGGALEIDLAGRSITPDNSHLIHLLQVAQLTRRCAMTFSMASAVASLIYGEGSR